jgi:hypothetical protein
MSETGGNDVSAVMTKFPGPVTLYAGKRILWTVCSVFVVIEFGLLKGFFAHGELPLAGWIAVAFFGLFLAITVYGILNRNVFALTLDRGGFRINFIFGGRRCSWKEVGDFATWTTRRFAVATYNDRGLAKSFFQRLMCRYRRMRYNRDTALPDTYGFDAKRLAQLMSLWQQRALADQA